VRAAPCFISPPRDRRRSGRGSMKLRWVPHSPGKYDPELIWGLLFVPMAAVAALLCVHLWGEKFFCRYRAFTGFRCPGCGATHAIRFLWHGAWAEAWSANPAVVVIAVAALGYFAYSSVVVFFRCPRLRLSLSPIEKRRAAGGLLIAFLAYWWLRM